MNVNNKESSGSDEKKLRFQIEVQLVEVLR